MTKILPNYITEDYYLHTYNTFKNYIIIENENNINVNNKIVNINFYNLLDYIYNILYKN